MSLEQVAGIALQVFLMSAWTVVFVSTMRGYLQFRVEKMTRSEDYMLQEAVRIERAFFTFAYIFLPSLMVWLPLIGFMSPDNQFFLPVVLTWLVILVFGSVQFHVGLTPTRAAWIAAISSAAPGAFSEPVFREKSIGKEPGRNV